MENLFINIPNAFLVTGKEKLTGDELYMYYHLRLHELRWYKSKIITSINLLSSQLQLMKNEHQNRKRIETVLLSMKEKDAINFVAANGYDETISIYAHDDQHYFKRKDTYKNGVEQIDITLFDKMFNHPPVDRGNFFLILCYAKKSTEGIIAYSTWADVLGISERQVKTIIGNMVNKGLLNVQSGRYYVTENKKIMQEINQYEVVDKEVDVVSELTESKDKYKWFEKKEDVSTIIYRLTTDKDKYQEYVNIEEIDFMYAIEHKDDPVVNKKFWNQKYKRLCNGKFKSTMDGWELEYKRIKLNNKNKSVDIKHQKESGHLVILKDGSECYIHKSLDWEMVDKIKCFDDTENAGSIELDYGGYKSDAKEFFKRKVIEKGKLDYLIYDTIKEEWGKVSAAK